MVDRWKDRLGRVDRAVDRAMSEGIIITPMLSGDYDADQRDDSRPIINTVGVLHVDRDEDHIGGNTRHIRNARVRLSPSRLEIDKNILPPGYDIRKNDAVEAVDKGNHYKVEWIDRQNPGRLVIMLAILE
jgi:hypothetical protein